MRTKPACLRWLSLWAVVTFSSLLAQDLMVSGPVYSQESAETLLEEGLASYNDLYIDEAITKLNRAVQLGLGNKDDLIRAYKYLAFAYITNAENDKARECFGEILKLDPFYELNKELSPKILQVLIQAQEEYLPTKVTAYGRRSISPCGNSKEITVKGLASIQANEDIASARNRAIIDALRRAVERVLGIYIEEEALIEDFSYLEVVIYKKTKGHVVTYEVIEDSERREGNIYELVLQAVVCLEPRILVIVPEVHGGREVQDPTAETAIINGLLKAGFPVVGKYELSNVRKGASVKKALKGDRKVALDLALQYGANVVIVGEGASEPAGTISGLHWVRAWLYARAFKTDEDIIVGAHSLQVSGLGITENAASREAFSLGGARMADYLVERLAEFRHPDAIKTIRLVINNLRSKSQFDELKQAITNMLLVIDAKVNLLEQDKAELIIKSLGGTQDLVEDLSNLGFIDLAIAKTHEHEIRVTVE